MARTKGTVYRVTVSPATDSLPSQPEEGLKAWLKAAIEDNLSDAERPQLTVSVDIVPSCDGSEDTIVALVEFHGWTPDFLSDLTTNPLGDWQIEADGCDVNFDRHFLGFTQLYTPKSDLPITADIIAITGLDGHAYGSWRGKGNLGRKWLRHFLSRDMPYCRTMTYGYNSKLSSQNIDTIMDYGRELLEELKKIRKTDEQRKRPLFFIAHSFGGIILAHCLVKAVQAIENADPTIATLYKATYGMLLFGIPHKGLVVDQIKNLLAEEDNHPRNLLLDQIKTKSDLLAFQLADFKNLIQDRKVVSFYETGQGREPELDRETKGVKRSGNYYLAVDPDSALFNLPDHIEDKIKLDADHSMMVKFDSAGARGYTSARDKLKQFEKDAPRVVEARFSQTPNRPKPSSTVPFQRDPLFVGRYDELTRLSDIMGPTASQVHTRAALIGLGGVGKSQIAIEYTYRVREATPDTWVFWVHASNAVRFTQSYRQIAATVELPKHDDPNADILPLVYNWLCDQRNGRWLIVIDNADDDRVLSFPGVAIDTDTTGLGAHDPGQTRSLASFIPQSPNGQILVTSRDQRAAMSLVGDTTGNKIIHVQHMDGIDGLALLKSRIPNDKYSEEHATPLIDALGGIPLAITQAAAFIAVSNPPVTVSGYLRLFRESDDNQAFLLNTQQTKDLRRDSSVSDAVITTWQIAFEQIRRTTPAATKLLSLMAMFDRQGIPDFLLRLGQSELEFKLAVTPLTSFSLIKLQSGWQKENQPEEQLFEMHGLVQLATRKWMELQSEVQRWQNESLRIMAAEFPNGMFETWPKCRVLFPHSKKLLGYNPDENDAKLERATIAARTAWYLHHSSETAAAESIIRSAVAARSEILGLEHEGTISSISDLASILTKLRKFEEAELLQRQVLEYDKKTFGPEHKNTLVSIRKLGSSLHDQCRYKEAESLLQQAFEGQVRLRGLEHKDTLQSMSKLGATYRNQGRWKEAEELHMQVLKGRQKVLGLEHPDTLMSMSNLGATYWRQGRWKEAEELHMQALKGRQRVLGLEHPDTLMSMSKLGATYWNQGRWKEAEELHMQVLKGRQRVLGPEHPGTLMSMSELGITYWSQGQWKEAEELQAKVLELRKRVVGLEHVETLTGMNNLACIYKSQGRVEEALVLMRECVEASTRVHGPAHESTVLSRKSLEKWEAEMVE